MSSTALSRSLFSSYVATHLTDQLKKIVDIAHAHGALVMVDNSIMSPVLSRPLELGADIFMHSATKFIAGHGDVMAAVLAVKRERMQKALVCLHLIAGSVCDESRQWQKQQDNAQKIAGFLSSNPRVKKVHYAGLADHPGRALHYSQEV